MANSSFLCPSINLLNLSMSAESSYRNVFLVIIFKYFGDLFLGNHFTPTPYLTYPSFCTIFPLCFRATSLLICSNTAFALFISLCIIVIIVILYLNIPTTKLLRFTLWAVPLFMSKVQKFRTKLTQHPLHLIRFNRHLYLPRNSSACRHRLIIL